MNRHYTANEYLEKVNSAFDKNIKSTKIEILTRTSAGRADTVSLDGVHVKATALRKADIYVEIDHMERSVKAQFKYADKLGAKYVAVIGGNELTEGKANVKSMATGESESVAFADMVAYFQDK